MPKVALHLVESWSQRVERKAGGLDFALVLRGAGYHRVHSALAQGRTHGDERMQVPKRPHRGKYDFTSQCFRNSERSCMRYCHLCGTLRLW